MFSVKSGTCPKPVVEGGVALTAKDASSLDIVVITGGFILADIGLREEELKSGGVVEVESVQGFVYDWPAYFEVVGKGGSVSMSKTGLEAGAVGAKENKVFKVLHGPLQYSDGGFICLVNEEIL